MRLVAVSRVLNEDDIAEAFVRHHAPLVDHHVLIDNGSVDRTLEILKQLAAEGLALTVFTNRTPLFSDTAFNTFLYRFAVEEQQADGVLFLDADEFLDPRRSGVGLRRRLQMLPAEVPGLLLPRINYHATAGDDRAEVLVPRRMRWRDPAPGPGAKLLLRRLLPSWKAVVDADRRQATHDGKELHLAPESRIVLAHFSDRGRWRWLSRAAIGRLKVLASGKQEIAQNRNAHYKTPYEMLRDAPEKLGITAGFGTFPPPREEWVEDRIRYSGGPLRFTAQGDERLEALRAVIGFAEALAGQHAELVDSNHAVRLQAEQRAMQFQRVV